MWLVKFTVTMVNRFIVCVITENYRTEVHETSWRSEAKAKEESLRTAREDTRFGEELQSPSAILIVLYGIL